MKKIPMICKLKKKRLPTYDTMIWRLSINMPSMAMAKEPIGPRIAKPCPKTMIKQVQNITFVAKTNEMAEDK